MLAPSPSLLVLCLCLGLGLVLGEDDDCEDYECPVKDGSFADPCTCRRYYQCVDFNPIKSFCPSGLYWDDIKKFCTYKDEAVCGPVASTEAPATTEAPKNSAKSCAEAACELPWCFCSSDGGKAPGGLRLEDTPQMVLLMLDGAVNQNNIRLYKRLFKDVKSPNSCPALGTFFLVHHYNNYRDVMDLRSRGHEMAVSSITDPKDLDRKNETAWENEVVGMRRLLSLQADIGEDEVLGIRAPGLKPGFNAQYQVLVDYGFIWDSSLAVPPRAVPVWPYTLDYSLPHECKTGTCPTKAFPGVWELPLNSHFIEGYDAGHCPYLDQCVFTNFDNNTIFEWLKEDFNRTYLSNKAPYTLPMHTNWFQTIEQRDAIAMFLDWLQEKDDVYFVTATQALLWMTDPVPLSKINSYDSWACDKELPPPPCKSPNKCSLAHRVGGVNGVRYMTTCKHCPNRYPWLTNTGGKDTEEKDIYEKFVNE